MKRKFLSVIAVFLISVTAAGMLSSCTRLSSTKKEKETVLTIGKYEVPMELYRYIALNFKKDCPDAGEDELKSKTEEALKDIYAVLSAAGNYDISPDDKYYKDLEDRAVKAATDEAGGKKEYKETLTENHMNDSVFRFLTTKDNIKNELYYAMVNKGDIDDSDENIKRLFESGDFICVKQILIKSVNSRDGEEFSFGKGVERTDEEARALAEDVRKKALENEDFDGLVRDFGESLAMMQNSDGVYVCRGMWETECEDCVFALDVGDISEVIESSAGFSIFMRCENDPAYLETGKSTLKDNYCGAQYALLTGDCREKLTIEYTENYKNFELSQLESDK